MALPESIDLVTITVDIVSDTGRCRNVVPALVMGNRDKLATLASQAQINNISIWSESRFKQFPCSVKKQ